MLKALVKMLHSNQKTVKTKKILSKINETLTLNQ